MWRIIWGKCRSTILVRDHLPRTRRGINSNRAPATYKWRTVIHTPPWEIVIWTSSVTGCFEVREEHKNCRDGTSFVISTGFGTFLIDWYKMRQRMRSQEHTNAASKNTWKIGWSSFCVENIDSQHLSRERQTDKTTPGRFSNNNTTQQQSYNFEKVYLMR